MSECIKLIESAKKFYNNKRTSVDYRNQMQKIRGDWSIKINQLKFQPP